MHALSKHGMRALGSGEVREVRGGNPAISLGIAVASAFGWGLRYGYTVVGPWMMGHDRL